MGVETLDFKKHGLAIKSVDGDVTYYVKGEISNYVEVSLFQGITVDVVIKDDTGEGSIFVVANRYQCETQEQLDFILLGGRARTILESA